MFHPNIEAAKQYLGEAQTLGNDVFIAMITVENALRGDMTAEMLGMDEEDFSTKIRQLRCKSILWAFDVSSSKTPLNWIGVRMVERLLAKGVTAEMLGLTENDLEQKMLRLRSGAAPTHHVNIRCISI